MSIALCQQKYNIQALDIIPAVETPCTLTNPHSQSLDWVGNIGNMINIKRSLSLLNRVNVETKQHRKQQGLAIV